MRIGDVAARTGVAPRMLRYYEDQSLLCPARHANGYRDYGDADVERVAVIRDLNRSGVPVRFIKMILDRQQDPTAWTEQCDNVLTEALREQVSDLDAKIACLTMSRDSLARLLEEAGPAAVG